MEIFEIVCAVSPFVTVTVCDWLVVLRLCAEKTKPPGLRAETVQNADFGYVRVAVASRNGLERIRERESRLNRSGL